MSGPNVRFMLRVQERPDGCWLWTGSTRFSSSAEYGCTFHEGRTHPAHRVAWMLLRGPIPEGLQIDHLCRNTLCVNPLHLEPVTQRENLRRGNTFQGINARKTHCVHGHEFTRDNTRIRRNGSRACRTCIRERRQATRELRGRAA